MDWTTERPTEPGWYWMMGIYRSGPGLFDWSPTEGWYNPRGDYFENDPRLQPTHWMGPVAEPEPPADV